MANKYSRENITYRHTASPSQNSENKYSRENIIYRPVETITATEFQHKLTQTAEGRAKLAARKAEEDFLEENTITASELAEKETAMLKAKDIYEETKKSYNIVERAMLAFTFDDQIDQAKREYENKLLEYREALAAAPVETEAQAKDNEERLKKTGSWGEYLGNAAWAGLNRIGQNFASTLKAVNDGVNWVLEKFGADMEDTAYTKWITKQKNDIDAYMENLQNKTSYSGLAVGDKQQIANNLVQAGIVALPDAVMAVVTAGASAGATVGKTALGTAAQSATKANLFKTTGTAIKNIAKNPFTYTSVMQSYGTTYDEALASGATKEEALFTATISSLFNAVVEVGGDTGNAGIQSLPEALKNSKGSWEKVLDWVKSALTEGNEEVIQGVITKLTQAVVYDNDKEIYSIDDADAIINPKEIVKEWGTGVAVSAILGEGQIAFDTIINAPSNKQLKAIGKQAIATGDISSIIEYAKGTIDTNIRAKAIKASAENISEHDAGTLYGYAYRDITKTLDSTENYEAMSEAYKNIMLNTESPAIRNIASSIYVRKTIDAMAIGQKEAQTQADIPVQNKDGKYIVDNNGDKNYNNSRGESYVRTDEFRRLQEESKEEPLDDSGRENYASNNAGLRSRLSSVFKRELERSGINSGTNKLFNLKYNKYNINFNIYGNVEGSLFHDVFEITRKYLKNGELVDLHGIETTDDGIGYNDCYNYLSKDGLSGFSITPDGDLISVFNASGKKGFLYAIAPIVKEKAKTLDCYASEKQNLQEMYQKVFGFKTASVMDYNMDFDHDNVAENHAMPQVAFMVNTDSEVETRSYTAEQYNEAKAYRDSFISDKNKGGETGVDDSVSGGYNIYERGVEDGQNAEILAGEQISADGGSGNSLRQQSENSGKIDAFLRDGKEAERDNGNRNAGNSGWLHQGNKKSSQFTRRHSESFLGTLRGLNLKNTDSIGRQLSNELIEKLHNTIFKDTDGTIFSLYHFTDVAFEVFAEGDVGFHFGTLDAANNRRNDPNRKKRGNEIIYKEVYLNIQNPAIIEGDPLRWDAFSTSEFLLRNGIFTVEEIAYLKQFKGFMVGNYDSEASVKLRELLKEKGYDGIIYTNGVEGDLSVIALDPEQIVTVAENGVLKENNGVIEADSNGSAFSMPKNSGNSVLDYIYRKGREGAKAFFDKITNRKNRNPTSKTDTDPLIDWVEQTGREDAVDFLRQKGLDKSGIINDNQSINPTYEILENQIITDGSHIENGKLKPNITYISGEHAYIYTTNEDGLIINAYTDDLQIKTHTGRKKHDPNTYGKKVGDHAGHLFGDRFGGSPKLDNLVSQAKSVNQKVYKKIENEWAKALKKGQKVTVNIDVIYQSGSMRPSSFNVTYVIAGVKNTQNITN